MRSTRFLFCVGLAAVIVSIISYLPVSAVVTFSGQNGQIAYIAKPSQQNELRTIHADGSRGKLLAKNAKSPTWSPNGHLVAFIDGQQRLRVINKHGVYQHCLAFVQGTTEHSPVWSADGRQLAFIREKPLSGGAMQSAVFSVQVYGKGEKNLTGWSSTSTYNSPTWSPDAKRIAYEKRTNDHRDIFIKNLVVGHQRLLTTLSDDVDSRITWSPSGKKLFYNDSRYEVYTIWPDGSRRAVISDGDSYQASWSPDGTKIAFIEDPKDKTISISGPDGSINYVPIRHAGYQTLSLPTWSPNGKVLLFTLNNINSGQSVSDLFAIELEKPGAVPQKVAENVGSDMSWQARQN